MRNVVKARQARKNVGVCSAGFLLLFGSQFVLWSASFKLFPSNRGRQRASKNNVQVKVAGLTHLRFNCKASVSWRWLNVISQCGAADFFGKVGFCGFVARFGRRHLVKKFHVNTGRHWRWYNFV